MTKESEISQIWGLYMHRTNNMNFLIIKTFTYNLKNPNFWRNLGKNEFYQTFLALSIFRFYSYLLSESNEWLLKKAIH